MAVGTIHRLTRRLKFPNHWPPVGIDYDTPLQRLSPTPYTFEKLSDSHCFSSVENIYVGHARWSQVYSGSLVSPTSIPIQGLKFDDVILKVYNTAFFPFPNSGPEYDTLSPPGELSLDSYRFTDELMAWAEAHAYLKLLPLQGRVVPHFIDAFMVKSPNSDEESIGIAMSRIQGKSFTERCQELGSENDGDARWFPLALELFRKIYEIHQLGVIGLDIRGPNVRVVQDPTKSAESSIPSESVMMIDFASSRPRSFPTEEERLHHRVQPIRVYDLSLLLNILLTVCGDTIGEPAVGSPGNRARAFLRWVRNECTNEPWFEDWWAIYFHRLKIDVDV